MLFNAGKAIIQGLINGIKNAAGAVAGAIGDVLAKARRLLPFSPAKEGPYSGRGWVLYSGMSIPLAIADGIRRMAGSAISEAAALAAAVQAELGITPTVDLGGTSGRAPSVPDLSGSSTQQAMAEAQLVALQGLVDQLAAQGKTLPDDLVAALEQLRVVVSANEVASGVKSVDQQNGRRR